MASHTRAALDDLRDIATRVAREAGDFALTMRRAGVDIAGSKSSAVDIVTKADQATEKLIRERLAELRPHDAVFGEEGATTAGTSGLTWVVDPIDGTVNYLYGIPAWGVSVAVVEGAQIPQPGQRWRAPWQMHRRASFSRQHLASGLTATTECSPSLRRPTSPRHSFRRASPTAPRCGLTRAR